MATVQACTFLSMPQELRDSIYDYALGAESRRIPPSTKNVAASKQAQCAPWTVHFDRRCPKATYLSLVQCNWQLWGEITSFLVQACQLVCTARLDLHATYPDMVTEWSSIPRPATQIEDLVISVKMCNLFDPALSTPDQHNILLRPVFETLRRYIYKGPHFARTGSPQQPLRVRTVRIALSSAMPLEEMTHNYASPTFQLDMLAGHLKALIARLAHSGLLLGFVGAFEVCLEGREPERIEVTSDVWDEQDYVFFYDAGFRW